MYAHLPALRALGQTVVAIADASAQQRLAASQFAPNAQQFDTAEALLNGVKVDAVVIGLPPALHAAGALQAFAMGAHVYVEKPLATSMSETHSLLSAWRAAGTAGMVGFNFRFHPQVQAMRSRLRAGEIGTPLTVRSTFSIVPHERAGWKRTRATGGGVLLDLASHHLDLIPYLLGEPAVRVSAVVRSLDSEADHASLQLEFASGVSAQLFASLSGVEEHRIEVFGTRGKLVMDRTELRTPLHVRASQQGARRHRVERVIKQLDPRLILRSPGVEPSFQSALSSFVSTASGGDAGGAIERADLLDGARAQALIDAAERSALSGRAETPESVR